MIPCKENKCILLPVCLSKRAVVCSCLHRHFTSLPDEKSLDDAWEEVHAIFIDLIIIRSEHSRFYKAYSHE